MRHLRLAVLLVLGFQDPAVAQGTEESGAADVPAVEVQPLGSHIRFFRWLEDYSALTDEARAANYLGPLKRIRFTDTPYPNLSVGGEYRLRYEHYSNQFYGIVSPASTDSVLQRLLLHSDVRVSESLRGFVQLSLYEESGNDLGPRPLDESEADIQLGFVDYTTRRLTARAGRQELSVGSGKFTGIREGPNQRRAFDAARLTVRGKDEQVMDVFYGREVQPEPGAFDDDTSSAPSFWGVYGTGVFSLGALHVDSYYLGLSRDNAVFDQGVADEERHTVGARLWGETGPWHVDLEGVYQFGEFGPGNIDAFGARSDIYYEPDSTWKVRPGLRLAVTSGDSDNSDNDLGTFSALFPNLNYNSEAAIYGPGNGYEVHPNIEIRPIDDLSVRLGVDFLWRQSTNDALYAGPGFPLGTGDTSSSRYVGSLQNVEVSWSPTPHVTVFASYVHADAGSFVRDGGGEDTDFAMVSVITRL